MLIESLLDNDLYKLTMMQFAFHHFPKADVEYRLFYRKQDTQINAELIDVIKNEIKAISSLRFQKNEIEFLRTLDLFSQDFLKYLETFRLHQKSVLLGYNGSVTLTVKGKWIETILWEVILLALINEIYFHPYSVNKDTEQTAKNNLNKKIDYLKRSPQKIKFIEFGTRRRFSRKWQEELNKTLKTELTGQFIGTSNIKLAMDCGIKCYGTMAHELLQAGQRISPALDSFQSLILNLWHKEYEGRLGIALCDVLSTEAFLHDFHGDLAEKYLGVRVDSGDPFQIGEELFHFYTSQGIDPTTKTVIFSDSLDFEQSARIAKHFKDRLQVVFGIGTYLTNDHGIDPLNLVIKMTAFNGEAVGKLTDCPNKTYCLDPGFLIQLKQIDKRKSVNYLSMKPNLNHNL